MLAAPKPPRHDGAEPVGAYRESCPQCVPLPAVIADDGSGHAAPLVQQFLDAGSLQNGGAGRAGSAQYSLSRMRREIDSPVGRNDGARQGRNFPCAAAPRGPVLSSFEWEATAFSRLSTSRGEPGCELLRDHVLRARLVAGKCGAIHEEN